MDIHIRRATSAAENAFDQLERHPRGLTHGKAPITLPTRSVESLDDCALPCKRMSLRDQRNRELGVADSDPTESQGGTSMEPQMVTLDQKTLVGVKRRMSIANDATADLWRAFMPRRKSIEAGKTERYYSVRVYSEGESALFSPETTFDKWAAIEVTACDTVPEGMEMCILRGGTYAVFTHRGPASTFPKTMQHIMGSWLPNSTYELDNREHFEVLPENYNPQDIEAEEEVWVPVRPKKA